MSRKSRRTKVSETKLDFILYPKQKLAMDGRANEILYGGAAGGGKSHLLRIAAITYCLAAPGIQVYLFRKQLTDLIKGHLSSESGFPNLLAPLVEAKMCKIDMSRYKVVFKNGGPGKNAWAGGSTIHLSHLSKGPGSLNNYQGAEIHVLMLDESTHFLASSYKYLRTRVRLGGWNPPQEGPYSGDYFPRILACTNPGGLSHSYWKQEFVDFLDEYEPMQMPEEKGGMRRMYISAKVTDNEILMKNDPTYVSRLLASGEKSYVEALLHGNWNISMGGILQDDFSFDTHIIDEFEIPRNWNIVRVMDWGAAKPFAVIWFAESNGEEVTLADGTMASFPPGTAFAMRELYGCKEGEYDVGLNITDKQIGERIKEVEDVFFKGYHISAGPADGSMWGKANKEFSIIDDINHGYYGRRIAMTEKLFTRFLKPKHSRVEGFSLIRTRLRNSLPFAEGRMEEQGLFFLSNCKHMIRTIPTLPRSDSNPDDSAPHAEDHLADALRYYLLKKISKVETTRVVLY